jgi:hypothetical protein
VSKTQNVTPCLLYRDAGMAMNWLSVEGSSHTASDRDSRGHSPWRRATIACYRA